MYDDQYGGRYVGWQTRADAPEGIDGSQRTADYDNIVRCHEHSWPSVFVGTDRLVLGSCSRWTDYVVSGSIGLGSLFLTLPIDDPARISILYKRGAPNFLSRMDRQG